MDPLGIDKAISDVNAKTIPEAAKALADVVDKLNALLSRLDGATITIKLMPLEDK